MSTDEFGEKSEQPTDHRRQEAREKGNVARSQDLSTAGHVLAAAALIFVLGIPTVQALAEYLQRSLSTPAWTTYDQGRLLGRLWDDGAAIADSIGPWLGCLMIVGLLISLFQVGFLVTPDALQPKLSRLNPISGLKRIFSLQGIVKLVISLGKLATLATLTGWFVWSELPRFLLLPGAEPAAVTIDIVGSLGHLAMWLALTLIALALLDFLYQKFKFEQDLRMTKQEVRDEMKNMDGDPLIRQRRREAHRKLATSREMQQVKTADFVLTNPTHYSVAIKYDSERMAAPTVVAKGVDELALRIREIATEHGVPIIERPELARAVYRDVKVGRTIPLDMYEVFVELLAYVYRISGRAAPNLD